MKHTGGNWNPKEGPTYFLAANTGRLRNAAEVTQCLLIAINELEGPKGEEYLREWLDLGRTVFLDSGIFNLTNEHARAHGTTMDEALALAPEEIDGFDDLFERYVRLCKAHESRLWGYIELDQGGRENKIRTRARLEAMGLRPIPVYHPLNDGWDYFDELARSYDRICFGNIVQAEQRERLRLIHTMWERKQRYPNLWIHCLGYTPDQRMYALPPNSADSSTWLQALRWPTGIVLRTMGKAIDKLGDGFNYVLGSDRDDDVGAARATKLSAMNSEMEMINWRNGLARVAELTGSRFKP